MAHPICPLAQQTDPWPSEEDTPGYPRTNALSSSQAALRIRGAAGHGRPRGRASSGITCLTSDLPLMQLAMKKETMVWRAAGGKQPQGGSAYGCVAVHGVGTSSLALLSPCTCLAWSAAWSAVTSLFGHNFRSSCPLLFQLLSWTRQEMRKHLRK